MTEIVQKLIETFQRREQ